MNYTISTIDKIDEKFEFSQISNYIKSIQLSLNGFSYIVTDPAMPAHLAIRSYNFGTEVSIKRLEEIIEDLFINEDILSQPSKKTYVSFVNRSWAMSPKILFNENRADLLLNVNFKKDDFAKIISHATPTSDIVFTTRIPDSIYNILKKYNQHLEVIPHQCAMSTNAFQTIKHHSLSDGYFLNINHQFFDLMVINNQKIAFYNNFAYKQYADVLYYTLATLEKLGADPGKIDFFIQGIDLAKDILTHEFSQFIKHVYLDRKIHGTAYSHHFDQLPLFEFKLLTGIYSCAL